MVEENFFFYVGWSLVFENVLEIGSEDFRDRFYYVIRFEDRVFVL